MKKDSVLSIRIKSHGYSTVEKTPNLGVSLLRARWATKTEIDSFGYLKLDRPKDLLFLYANKDSNKEPLWCPSGLPKEEIVKRYYYVLFIWMKELTIPK